MGYQRILMVTLFLSLLLGLSGNLWAKPENTGKTKTTNLTLDSIEAKLKSNEDLSLFINVILKSNHSEKAIPTLKKLLLQGYRPYNRAKAAKALAIIWRRTKDKRIAPILKQALKDSAEVVQIEVLEGLNLMGEEVPMDMVERLARGEGKEKWIVDWGGPANPLEYMTEEQVEENKKMFRDKIQYDAISLFVEIEGEKSKDFLKEIRAKTESDRIKRVVDNLLNKLEERVITAKFNKPPFPVGPELPKTKAEKRAFHRSHLQEYLRLVDSLLYEPRYSSDMDILLHYIGEASDLSALSTLERCLFESPCAHHRALAAKTIGKIEKYNKDKSAVPALTRALNDPVTEVQLAAAEALVEMGEYKFPLKTLTSLLYNATTEEKLSAASLLVKMGEYEIPFEIISQIAKGEGKESWTGEWKKYFGVETPEAIEEVKRLFRMKAIALLAEVKTSDAVQVLEDIAQHDQDPEMRRLASSYLEKLKIK